MNAPSTTSSSSGKHTKPLQRLIAQQTNKMEDLQLALEQAQTKVTLQDHQLVTWKGWMESMPTQLDTMLNEFTAKTATSEETIQTMESQAKLAKEEHDT
jgi:hypothetical protein